TRRPTGSPSSSAMRSAAARAATRRGLSSTTCPVHHGSPISAGATAVVLPAPGGATSTAELRSRRAASSAGSTAWIGRSADTRPPYSTRHPRESVAQTEGRPRAPLPLLPQPVPLDQPVSLNLFQGPLLLGP